MRQLRGLFATHHPCRAISIGLPVQLLARRDNVLEIEGVDVLDSTPPLLDIKPYVLDLENGHACWLVRGEKQNLTL